MTHFPGNRRFLLSIDQSTQSDSENSASAIGRSSRRLSSKLKPGGYFSEAIPNANSTTALTPKRQELDAAIPNTELLQASLTSASSTSAMQNQETIENGISSRVSSRRAILGGNSAVSLKPRRGKEPQTISVATTSSQTNGQSSDSSGNGTSTDSVASGSGRRSNRQEEQLPSDFAVLSETHLVRKQKKEKRSTSLRKKQLDLIRKRYAIMVVARRVLRASFHRPGNPEPLPFLRSSEEVSLEEDTNDAEFGIVLKPQTPSTVPVKRRRYTFSSVPKLSDPQTIGDVCRNGNVQDCACTELPPTLSRCLECREAQSDKETAYCRFRDFRKLISNADDTLSDEVSFICYKHEAERKSSSDAANICEWLPTSTNASSLDEQSNAVAEFIVYGVADYFTLLLEKERKVLEKFRAIRSTDSRSCPPWKDSAGVRDLCDVCSTTIFNLHVFCPHCGFSVCAGCWDDRLEGVCRGDGEQMVDVFGWAYCTRGGEGTNICHEPSDMILAHLIPNCGPEILSTLDELEGALKKQLLRLRSIEKPPMTSTQSTPPHWHLLDGQVLVIKEPRASGNLRLFQDHWKLAHPLIVENVHKDLSSWLWKPEVIAEICCNHSSVDSIVDCRSGCIMMGITANDFWSGFLDCGERLRDNEGRKFYLKLKDWPPGDKFSSILREHYVEFCNALPIPEYTHPDKGCYNLATRLPSFCLAPDLGPKMYTAYDMIFESEKGTTNLHLDVSDAVNVLVNVTTPSNINLVYLYRAINDYLEAQGLDCHDLERAKRYPHNVGALWTIFKPEDNASIREFLDEILSKRAHDVNDPIHDQKVYLHRSLRLQLERERNVKGFTFLQMLGDAVFIPAGAAHQVQNLLCCIKVAEDFVSPEGIHRCALITNEFRALTKDHSNHEDKLQLSNIVTHALRDALSVLEGST